MRYDYNIHCALLWLDRRFTTMLRVRDLRGGPISAAQMEKDAEIVDELKWLHSH